MPHHACSCYPPHPHMRSVFSNQTKFVKQHVKQANLSAGGIFPVSEAPVLSPYGHVFEEDTPGPWVKISLVLPSRLDIFHHIPKSHQESKESKETGQKLVCTVCTCLLLYTFVYSILDGSCSHLFTFVHICSHLFTRCWICGI